MTIQAMAFSFKVKADRLDSKQALNLSTPAILYLLNEGQISFVKKRYGLNNGYRTGFEGNQKRIDELQFLSVPEEELTMEPVDKKIFIADLSKTKEKYMFLLRTQFLGKKAACTTSLSGVLVQTDDLDVVENSTLYSSSFEWREVNFRLAQNKVRAYTDETFELTLSIIDYLRQPREMDMAGYQRADNTPGTDVDCELPEYIHPDIVDEAIFIYKGILADPGQQAAMLKMANNE